MVLHPEACWGGLPMHAQKTNIYNLETGEFASTLQCSKPAFSGSYLALPFGGIFSKTIWRELFQKTFSGNI